MSVLDNSGSGRPRLAFAVWIAVALMGADPAAAQNAIRFTLDWNIEGPDAPFVVATDKGYYRAERLDVAIDPAVSSLEALGRIASGTYDMGVADINTFMKFRDQNPNTPVKAVFVVHDKAAYAIIGRKSRGVVTPLDLEGRKLGAPSLDAAYAKWPIFAQVNGIDAAKVMIVNIGGPVREPMLAAGEVDAVTGLSFSTFVDVKGRGVEVGDITMLLMADYGVELYGDVILVNTKFAAAKPELVKAYLRAYVRGLKETVRNPIAAVESVLARNEGARKDVELERLQIALKTSIVTPEVRTRGFGDIDAPRLATAINQMAIVHAFKTKPTPEDLFNPSFLPALADRKPK